jgi:DNA polymerase III epsilon subunit-like protein
MVAGEPPFGSISHLVKAQIEAAPLVIGQNLSFDVEMIDLEFERLGEKLTWPRKKICTVEQTIHFKGYRLNLSDLHEHLFGERFDGAHRAKNDVLATVRCLSEMRKRGLL